MMKRLLLVSLFVDLRAWLASGVASMGEYIILVGGPSMYQWEKYKTYPHDHWWANFVRAARLRTEQLRTELGPDAKITWLVYRQGYEDRAKQEHQDLISLISSVRDKYNINLIWFGPGEAVINYLNNGEPRDQVKVIGFEYFGHSNRACFMFDYSNIIDSACKSWLHENDLFKINRAFSPGTPTSKAGAAIPGRDVQKMVRRHRHRHDRRNRQDAVHDGGTADPHFRERQMGLLRMTNTNGVTIEARSSMRKCERPFTSDQLRITECFRDSVVIRHSVDLTSRTR